MATAGQTLGDGLAALRTGFLALRAAPADAGKQQATVAAAETLAGRLNGVSQAIGTARQQAQDGIVAEVRTANAALREVAALTLKLRRTAPMATPRRSRTSATRPSPRCRKAWACRR